MEKSIFYHAGCPVCVSAEQELLSLIDKSKVEVVHLGRERTPITEAEQAGLPGTCSQRISAEFHQYWGAWVLARAYHSFRAPAADGCRQDGGVFWKYSGGVPCSRYFQDITSQKVEQ